MAAPRGLFALTPEEVAASFAGYQRPEPDWIGQVSQRVRNLGAAGNPMNWWEALRSLPDPMSAEARQVLPSGEEMLAFAQDANPIMGLLGTIKALPNPMRERIANELTREQSWEALSKAAKEAGTKRSPTTGRYTGAGPSVTSPQKKSAIAGKYAQRVQDALDAGIPPGYFYAEGRKALGDITDNAAEHQLVAQLMGPTSTQVGPFENVGYMVRALDQQAMGVPTSVTLYPNSLRPTVDAVLAGTDPWKGYKVDRYSNLLGAADDSTPLIARMPPNDQWEGFGTGLGLDKQGKKLVPSGPTQVAFSDHIRQMAADRINKQRIARGERPLSLPEIQELHWAAIRAQTDGRPLVLAPGDTVQGSLPAYEFQHSWEAQPGVMSGMRPQMPAQDYFDEVAGLLVDPQGKDRLVRAMGGRVQSPAVAGGGIYEGAVSPGMQSRSYAAFTQANGLDPASLARVDATEAVRQYMLGQDARAGHLFRAAGPGTAQAQLDTVDFVTGGAADMQRVAQLQARADKAFGAGNTAIVPTARGYRVLNVGQDSLSNKEFARIAKDIDLPGERTLGYRSGIYEERPAGQGGATRGLLSALESSGMPGPLAKAESAATREIAGQMADLYQRLEAAGQLTGSQTLSRALEAWSSRGLEGLRELVRQGLAPAALLALLAGYDASSQQSGAESGRGLL